MDLMTTAREAYGSPTGWLVQVHNTDSQQDCGGAFVTRRHILTSPSCLLVNGEPVKDVSKIIIEHSEMREPLHHYRFPSIYLDENFRGAEIAILEVKRGLRRNYPLCVAFNSFAWDNKLWIVDSSTLNKLDPVVIADLTQSTEMTDCLKADDVTDQTKPQEHCTIIIAANSSSSRDFARGDPVFGIYYSQQFFMGLKRGRKDPDAETVDGKLKGLIRSVSAYYWGQFICEHTGACPSHLYFPINDRFRNYIEDGSAFRSSIQFKPLETEGERFDAVVMQRERKANRFSSVHRISKTEAVLIRQRCGRGSRKLNQPLKYDEIIVKHLYIARIFMGKICMYPECTDPFQIYETKKICDCVFISDIHVLTSLNCFRTVNFTQADHVYVMGLKYDGRKNQSAVNGIDFIERAVGPLCYDETSSTANDFVILIVARPLNGTGRASICLPTREMIHEFEKKDSQLALIDLIESGIYVEKEVNAKLKRVKCSETQSCSYFDVETSKTRSELVDGTPLVYKRNEAEGSEVHYLAGLLVGRMNNTDNSMRATDAFHMLDRICLLTGNIALHEHFDISESIPDNMKGLLGFYKQVGYSSEAATEEFLERLDRESQAPKISQLSKEENVELQHMCGKGTPQPMVNYGINMSSSQFVVGIGILRNYPVDFSYGSFCSGVIISKKHVITASHCVDKMGHNPSRYVVYYGSNCFNPIFSRSNHSTHYDSTQVPCPDTQQRIMFVKHVITPVHQLWRSRFRKSTKFPPEYHYRYRMYGVGDFAILELRDELILDSKTSPICMPKRTQTYRDQILLAYGIGGATFIHGPKKNMTKTLAGLVARATFYNNSRKHRFGNDEDYWIEIEDFEDRMTAINKGDSGGPWMRKGSDHRSVLVATTSHGKHRYSASGVGWNGLWLVGPNYEREVDFICRWTGICTDGADAARDKQAIDVDGVEYCEKCSPVS